MLTQLTQSASSGRLTNYHSPFLFRLTQNKGMSYKKESTLKLLWQMRKQKQNKKIFKVEQYKDKHG